jgi:hypothetical protein
MPRKGAPRLAAGFDAAPRQRPLDFPLQGWSRLANQKSVPIMASEAVSSFPEG